MNVPQVQNLLKDVAVKYLNKKLHTTVQLDHLALKIPSSVQLDSLYIEDQAKDTLVYTGHLYIKIDMLGLLSGNVHIDSIRLDHFTANVNRTLPDTAFNFNYILKAFGANEADTTKDTSSTGTFYLGSIHLSHIRLHYNDVVTGYDATANLGDFATRFTDFNLDSMRFLLDSIKLSGLYSNIVVNKPLVEPPKVPEKEEDTGTSTLPELDFKGLVFSNLKVQYADHVSEMNGTVNLDTLLLFPDTLNLNNRHIKLKKLALNKSDIVFSMKSGPAKKEPEPEPETTLPDTTTSTPWLIALDSLQFIGDHFKFDDQGKPHQKEGIDFNHLDVNNFTLLASNIYYTNDSSHASVGDIAFQEQSGFNLQRLTADAVYTNKGAILKNLLLQTPNSRISKYLAISYPALDSLSTDPGSMGVNVNIDSGQIGLKDLFYFQPDMASNAYLSGLAKNPIQLNGILTGKLSDLKIDSFWIKAANNTALALNAHLVNLLHTDRAMFDLTLDHFTTGRKDLQLLLPDSLIPASVRVPDRLTLSGTYKGSLQSFDSRLKLRSSDGRGTIRANVRNLQDSLHATYNVLADFTAVQLGHLLKNDTLYGPVSLATSVKGTGLTPKGMQAQIRGKIKQAFYQGYTYRNLNLEGSVNKGKGKLTAEMKDPNLNFNLASQADLGDSIPKVQLALNLRNADLYALHFVQDTLNLQGRIKADFDRLDIDKPEGQLALTNWNIQNDSGKIHIDSVLLKATSSDTLNQIQLTSPLATLDLTGNYKLSEAGALMQYFQNEFLGTDSSKAVSKDSLSSWDMHLDLNLLSSSLWHQLLPPLESFNGAEIKGLITTSPENIQIEGSFKPFNFNGISVDSIGLGLFSKEGKLHYALTGNAIQNSAIDIPFLSLIGQLDSNAATLNLKILDQEQKDQYHLAGKLDMTSNRYTFRLNPDSLRLNYENWTVPEENYVQYSPKSLVVHQLKLQNENQYLSVNSDSSSGQSPLNITFHDFEIPTITRMVLSDSMDLKGLINGDVKVDSIMTNPLFVSDLRIDSLAMGNQPIGAILVKVDNKLKDTYSVNMQLTGNENDLKITGAYHTAGEGSFDLDMDMTSLPLSTVQALSFGQIKDARGKLTGDLKVKGTTEEPQIEGQLTFKDAGLNIVELNNYFKLPDESITFNSTGIHFDDFTLLDSANNKAILDGDILTKRYDHFNFNLNLNAKNYQLLNVPKGQGENFYGKVYISVDAKIRGDEKLPKVNAQLELEDKSDFTMVLQEENPEVVSSSGVVEFIDVNAPKDSIRTAPSDSVHTTNGLTGIDVSADIAIDTSAILNLVIDPANGDNLSVRGKADLNFTMDPGGKMSLTGQYTILNGVYNLSLEGLIKRKFNITRGSQITWTGDPMSANMDITAMYEVETSALDLVEDQLTDVSDAEKNRYKQRLPFEVYLNLKGELMQPDISFQLDMPQKAQQAFDGAVYTRIKQINTEPSEVNKQTLGLLVLGHFIADNPFETANGGGPEQMVRESASKILSQQLNRLAGNLIHGVDVSFDVQSSQDYSSGQAENQTNLNVGLSKSLFNDRTTVYVGSNIPLEGGNKQQSSQIVGDVSVEYKLSRDGRYRLRAYRKNKYQGVIEGEYIETGLSFIIVMDYNEFKDLFKKASELSDE